MLKKLEPAPIMTMREAYAERFKDKLIFCVVLEHDQLFQPTLIRVEYVYDEHEEGRQIHREDYKGMHIMSGEGYEYYTSRGYMEIGGLLCYVGHHK